MNIRKLSIISLVLLCSSVVYPMWVSNMNEDSQKLLGGLEQVVQTVNEKYPGFYDAEKEREIVKKEFSREYLNSYARSIAEHMKHVECEVRPIVGKYRFFVIKEFIEFIKLIGEYDQFDTLSKWHRSRLYGWFIGFLQGHFVGGFISKVRNFSQVKDITGHQRKFEGKEKSYEDEQTEYYQYYSEQAKDIAQRGLFKLFKIICKDDEQKAGLLEKCFGKNGESLNYETISVLKESQEQDVKHFIDTFFEKGTEIFQVEKRVFEGDEKTGGWVYKEDILAEPEVWILKPDAFEKIVSDFYFPQCMSLRQLEDFVAQDSQYLTGYNVILKDAIYDQKITGLRLWTTDNLDIDLRNKIAKRIGAELFVCKTLFSALNVKIDYNPKISVFMSDPYEYSGDPEKKNKKINVYLRGCGNLDVHLLPGTCKKIFPERKKVFRAANANSATCISAKHILIVFRKEEILKTVLHEMNHQIDVGSDNFSQWLGENFAIEQVARNGSLLMDEVVVESMACIANAIMSAYEIDPDNFLQVVSQMFEREKLFSIYQAAKILYLSGFDSFEQFYNPKKGGPRVKQVAAVAEYHILKAAAINNIDGFLGIFMNPENKDMYTWGQKRKLEKERGERIVDTGKVRRNNRLKYHVLRNMRVCILFKNKVNTFLKAFNEGIIPCNHHDDFFATGRMTIVEPRI